MPDRRFPPTFSGCVTFGTMTYQNVWWYPNYINYHNDVNCTPTRWSKPWDEKPQPSFHDRRYFAPAEDHFEERLYYTLIEKPHVIPKHPPDPCVRVKPAGFHVRVYHEDLPPGYKYHGPKKDELYWFEKNPYMPVQEDRRLATTKQMYESYRQVKMKPKQLELFTDGPDTTLCGCVNGLPAIVPVNDHDRRCFAPAEDHFKERLYYTLLRLGWPQSRSLIAKPSSFLGGEDVSSEVKKTPIGGPLFFPFKRMLRRDKRRRSATVVSTRAAAIATPSPKSTRNSISTVRSQIQRGPANALKKVGDSVTLECVTVNKNCEMVEWQKVEGLQSPKLVYRNGIGMLNNDLYSPQRYSVNSTGGCSLTITQLEINDSGRFICMQAVDSGEETRISILIVINVRESCLSNVTSNALDKDDGYSFWCAINIPAKSVESSNVTLSFHDKSVGETETTDEKQPLTVKTTLTGTATKENITRVCRASFPPNTEANYDSTTAYLDVCTTQQLIVSYPVVSITVSTSDPYSKGDTVGSTADGHPSTTFKWTHSMERFLKLKAQKHLWQKKSSNLLNAVQKKNVDGPIEKKMAARTGLQRAALGNISNKGVLLTKPDAQKGLKDKKVVEKVALKKSTTVVNSSNNPPTAKQIKPHVDPVAPVVPIESSVSMAPSIAAEERQEEAVAICQVKKLPVRQETVIEVEEYPASDESSIEIDVSASSVSMDTSGQSEATTKEEAFSNQMYTLMLRDIDEEDGDNPQLVSEYAKDIYHYMMTLESQVPIRQNHLSKQPEVNARMRCILVDWLIQVHQRFHLLQETLFLTVAILDRYLQSEFVPKTKLQLVGVASMWIAAKYEEMYAPEVADFAYITDHAYTKAEIRSMECAILRALDFSFGRPLPIHFLRRFSKAGDVDARTHNLAKYFMELAMVPCETAHIKPSFMAAAALRLAQKLLGDYTWGSLMVYYTSYDETVLAPLMAKLAQIAMTAGTGKTTAVKTKYQSSKLMKVSVLDELNSEHLHEVATWPTASVFPN